MYWNTFFFPLLFFPEANRWLILKGRTILCTSKLSLMLEITCYLGFAPKRCWKLKKQMRWESRKTLLGEVRIALNYVAQRETRGIWAFAKVACTETVYRAEVFSPCRRCPKYKPVMAVAPLGPCSSACDLWRVLLCSYRFTTERAKMQEDGKWGSAAFADGKQGSWLSSLAANIQEICWQIRKLGWHKLIFIKSSAWKEHASLSGTSLFN